MTPWTEVGAAVDTRQPSGSCHGSPILVVQDLEIRIVHAQTGELLRELSLDPRLRPQQRRKP